MTSSTTQIVPARAIFGFWRAKIGSDVIAASRVAGADQCTGVSWLVGKSLRKAVLPARKVSPTPWDVNAILISRLEQSGDRSRDLARHLPMAQHRLATFGGRA